MSYYVDMVLDDRLVKAIDLNNKNPVTQTKEFLTEWKPTCKTWAPTWEPLSNFIDGKDVTEALKKYIQNKFIVLTIDNENFCGPVIIINNELTLCGTAFDIMSDWVFLAKSKLIKRNLFIFRLQNDFESHFILPLHFPILNHGSVIYRDNEYASIIYAMHPPYLPSGFKYLYGLFTGFVDHLMHKENVNTFGSPYKEAMNTKAFHFYKLIAKNTV